MTRSPRPPCPYCQTRQAYTESVPAPLGCEPAANADRDTYCRACGERMVWGFRYGSGRLSERATGPAVFRWSKPAAVDTVRSARIRKRLGRFYIDTGLLQNTRETK